MPTYDYQCACCGREVSVYQSISEYVRDPKRPCCIHGGETVVMDRKLSVVPWMGGGAMNALAGDRHYEGLVSPDGTDIGSRTKHREYMRNHGLTTADDFRGQWTQAERERTALRRGEFNDPELRSTVKELVEKAVAQPD